MLEGAQLLGFTRMSLPFLFGTFVSGDRGLALVLGYVLYCRADGSSRSSMRDHAGGRRFELVVRAGAGLRSRAFLVIVFLPLLPYVHPRMATEYSGPDALRRLEPPGAFGLNYGRATPVSTVIAQVLFGLILPPVMRTETGCRRPGNIVSGQACCPSSHGDHLHMD